MWFFKKKAEKTVVKATDALAVVLIDMQPHFVANLTKRDKTSLINNQNKLLAACAERNIFVVILELGIFGKTIEELQGAIDTLPRKTVINKSRNSGFDKTCLDATLRGQGVQTLLLTGINASFCVKETAQDAKELNYEVLTANNLIADGTHHRLMRKSKSWYRDNGIYGQEIELV